MAWVGEQTNLVILESLNKTCSRNLENSDKNLVLVLNGGAMTGVFGAGVLTAFTDAGLYPSIHSIYGISAGAHNAAYFLTTEAIKGSSIYYEDLIDGHFIKHGRFGSFFRQAFLNIFRSRPLEVVVDIDYLMQVERTNKKLETAWIPRMEIGFFIRVFNIEKKKLEYLRGDREILEKLRASSGVIPFFPKTTRIGDYHYADGDTLSVDVDDILLKLIRKEPDKKFVFVFNKPLGSRIRFKGVLMNLIWSLATGAYLKNGVFIRKFFNSLSQRHISLLSKLPNVEIIESRIALSNFCDKQDELLALYRHGYERGGSFLEQLGYPVPVLAEDKLLYGNLHSAVTELK